MIYVDKLKVKEYQYLATYSSERLERNYIIMRNKLSLFIKKDSIIISAVQLSEKYDSNFNSVNRDSVIRTLEILLLLCTVVNAETADE